MAVGLAYLLTDYLDNRMDRCWLQGSLGDALHTLGCRSGYNLRWLLCAIARLGIGPILFAPVAGSVVAATGQRKLMQYAWALVECEREQVVGSVGVKRLIIGHVAQGAF